MIEFEDIKLKETLEIISKLNEEFYDQCGEFGIFYRPFQYHCDGCNWSDSAYITFFSQQIWDTEDDEREYSDESTNKEPLEDFLRKQANIMLNTLKKIKL